MCRNKFMHVLRRFGGCGHKGAKFLPFGRNSGSAAEVTFGRRTPLWRQFRLPKPAPETQVSSLSGRFGRRKCRRTCMTFGCTGTFGRRTCRRKCPVQPFLACFHVMFSGCFRGFLGSILESCSCMFGPSFESTCVGSDPRNRDPRL